MRIVQIIPGSGGSFYCGNCMRDSKYIEAIRSQGNDVIIVPMYLPLFPEEENEDAVPVFYGAISLYLKEKFSIFRHLPEWFDKLLNSKPMLKFAARMANSTRSGGLEDMTISMLLGEHGRQKEELEKMAEWLKEHYKADIIHISNALLIGLAHKLKEKLNIPVVCTLQDEDVWVDAMNEKFRDETWQLISMKAKDIDLFISVSQYYTSFMKQKLKLDDDKISTLHLGVDPADYIYKSPLEKKKNIGYLSRLCKENGLDILVDAFILLKQKPKNKDCKLLLTGGHTADDNSFIAEQKKKLKNAGLESDYEIINEFGQESRNKFFDSIVALSVPVRNGEAFGIYLTEAMAAGVPVVQPRLGAFPEIIAVSGGGVVYDVNDGVSLSVALHMLINNDNLLDSLSKNARQSIEKQFNINELSAKLSMIYKETIEKSKS